MEKKKKKLNIEWKKYVDVLHTSVYSADSYQLLRHKLTRDVSNKSKHIFL